VRANRTGTIPVRADLQALPFRDGSFDHVVAITVLYTVADDVAALREIARVLAAGAAIVLVEPAFESLRRSHDTVVHGRRRYRRDEIVRLVRDAGLSPVRATYAYSFLAPVAAALATADRVRGGVTPSRAQSDIERRSLDPLFAALARTERRLLARHDVPVGTSVVVLATRD
jgi:SAM-dependent methyltransferase